MRVMRVLRELFPNAAPETITTSRNATVEFGTVHNGDIVAYTANGTLQFGELALYCTVEYANQCASHSI